MFVIHRVTSVGRSGSCPVQDEDARTSPLCRSGRRAWRCLRHAGALASARQRLTPSGSRAVLNEPLSTATTEPTHLILLRNVPPPAVSFRHIPRPRCSRVALIRKSHAILP
jgi:hypothetical protein